MIVQVLLALLTEIARAAEAEVFEVSLKLLIQYFPDYVKRYADPMRAYAHLGWRLRLIRPVKREQIAVPAIPPSAMILVPAVLVTTRTPRYAANHECAISTYGELV